jgi:hypothetical protein
MRFFIQVFSVAFVTAFFVFISEIAGHHRSLESSWSTKKGSRCGSNEVTEKLFEKGRLRGTKEFDTETDDVLLRSSMNPPMRRRYRAFAVAAAKAQNSEILLQMACNKKSKTRLVRLKSQ